MQHETTGRIDSGNEVDEDFDDDEEFSVGDDSSDSDFSDNVGDMSVEINVEELVARVESSQDDDAARKKEIRRRLEELAEEKDLEDTFAMEFDKD